MDKLERLEALAQRLVEGTFRRFFQTEPENTGVSGYHTLPLSGDAPPAQADTKEISSMAAERHMAQRWRLHLEDRHLALGDPVINIGRALDNDVVLSEQTVSRYHAQLRWRQGQYYLCPPSPLGQAAELHPETQANPTVSSAPFTRLNGQPVTSGQLPLAAGDMLEFGKIRLMVEIQQRQP